MPWNFNNAGSAITPVALRGDRQSAAGLVLEKGLAFFRDYISAVDGDRCSMYPTCSSYGVQAVQKHGFFIGLFMTADRLIHESNEMDYAPQVNINGRIRFFDPVEWNDFWWSPGVHNPNRDIDN
ncbi:MAG: membrane protein insertion efficiency factor YidD [Syntrophales bacterium]